MVRAATVAGVAVIALVAIVTPVWALKVAVILSMNNTSSQGIQKGFESELSSKGISVQRFVYNLQEQNSASITGQVIEQKPDLVLAVGGEASKLLKSNLSSFNGVYAFVSNNAEYDSATTTGVGIDLPAALRVERIKAVLPKIKRIGVLFSPSSEADFNEISEACKSFGVTAAGRKVSTEGEFRPALQSLFDDRVDCIMMVADAKLYYGQTVKLMLLESIKNKVPVIGLSTAFTKGGALMSIECNYEDLGVQAGELGVRILSGGEKPVNLKSKRPRKAQYSFNAVIANMLGVSVSDSAAAEATEVIR